MVNQQPSNEQAVTFARQMLARKKATEKKMVAEYQYNVEAQAAVAKLQEALRQETCATDGPVTV